MPADQTLYLIDSFAPRGHPIKYYYLHFTNTEMSLREIETSCPRPESSGLSDSKPHVCSRWRRCLLQSVSFVVTFLSHSLGPFPLKWLVHTSLKVTFLPDCFTQTELAIPSVELHTPTPAFGVLLWPWSAPAVHSTHPHKVVVH